MGGETAKLWSERLASLAAPVLAGTPLTAAERPPDAEAAAFAAEFCDEKRHRREVDLPLLSRMLGLRPARPAACSDDVSLWWGLIHPDARALDRLRTTTGPLLPGTPRDLFDSSAAWDAIEVWTEAELCALHALSHHVRADASLAPRIDSAIDWLMENVQPDNATNHPWAVHVFIDRWLRLRDQNCRMYAGTLLHNAQVGLGRPDRFSAVILLDGGRWLASSPARADA